MLPLLARVPVLPCLITRQLFKDRLQGGFSLLDWISAQVTHAGRVFVLCTGESFNNSLEGECETYLLRNFNIIERVTGYFTIVP